MAYRLKEKENAFRVTREGPFESHRFDHGILYDKVPDEEKNRFEPASPGALGFAERQAHQGGEVGGPSDEGAQKKSKGVK